MSDTDLGQGSEISNIVNWTAGSSCSLLVPRLWLDSWSNILQPAQKISADGGQLTASPWPLLSMRMVRVMQMSYTLCSTAGSLSSFLKALPCMFTRQHLFMHATWVHASTGLKCKLQCVRLLSSHTLWWSTPSEVYWSGWTTPHVVYAAHSALFWSGGTLLQV